MNRRGGVVQPRLPVADLLRHAERMGYGVPTIDVQDRIFERKTFARQIGMGHAIRQLERYVSDGVMPFYAADEWACAMNTLPHLVWGEAWIEAAAQVHITGNYQSWSAHRRQLRLELAEAEAKVAAKRRALADAGVPEPARSLVRELRALQADVERIEEDLAEWARHEPVRPSRALSPEKRDERNRQRRERRAAAS